MQCLSWGNGGSLVGFARDCDSGSHSVTFGQTGLWPHSYQARNEISQGGRTRCYQRCSIVQEPVKVGTISCKKFQHQNFPPVVTLHFRGEVIWNSSSWSIVLSPSQGKSPSFLLIQIDLVTVFNLVHGQTSPATALLRKAAIINRNGQKRKCLPLNNCAFLVIELWTNV